MCEEKMNMSEETIEKVEYKAEEILFKDLKAIYKQRRKDELTKLKKFLKKHFSSKGFVVEINLFSRDTFPKKHYRSRGKSEALEIAPYDNTNWLGLDVILTDNNSTDADNTGTRYAFFISLQSFDYDDNKGNYHVLMDRLGVYMYHGDNAQTVNALAEMYTTDFDLPLSKKDLKGLAELLEQFISNDPNLLEKRIERIKVRRNAAKKSIIDTIKNFDKKAMNNKKFITDLIKELEELNKELDY